MRNLSAKTATEFGQSLDQTVLSAQELADNYELLKAKELFHSLLAGNESIRIHNAYIRLLADFESSEAALGYAEGIESLLSRHSDSPEDLAEFFNLMASLYRKAGLYPLAHRSQQVAIQHELSVAKQDVLSARALLGQAFDLYHEKDFASAKYLLIALRRGSDEIATRARLLLAEIYLKEHENRAAKFVLEETLVQCDCVQLKVEVLRLKSRAALRDDQFAAAKKLLDTAMSLAKNSARCVNQIPDLCKESKKLKQQLEICAQNAAWN